MAVLLYLAVPFVAIAVAVLVLWLRERKPTSVESGIASFRRVMEALSPENAEAFDARRSGGPIRRR
jgi:uncharacterized protein YoxC